MASQSIDITATVAQMVSVTNLPSVAYTPSRHAPTHISTGTDPIPLIVVSYKNQNSALSNITLLPLGGSGVFPSAFYRIDSYLNVNTIGNNVTIEYESTWSDGVSFKTHTSSSIPGNANGFIQQHDTVWATDAYPIQFNTLLGGSLGSGTYSVYVVAEQI